jgi:hypothetical protein
MAKKKITRDEAIERNLTRYYTGKPCRNNHKVERYVQTKQCVQCGLENNVRRNVTANPTYKKVKAREKNLKDRYGITLADYMQMADRQGGRCASCGNLSQDLMVDHCHTSKKVRGLLCNTCNAIIGFASDNITILQLTIEYLVKHS